MRLDIFHLKARSSFHFGERGVGIEVSADHAPSDTIFGALCNVVRTTLSLGTLEELLERFRIHQPPFLLSSGFPYVMLDNKPLRFYPAPVSLARLSGEDLDEKRLIRFRELKVRSIRWISEALYLRWLQGELTAKVLVDEAARLPHNHILVTNENGGNEKGRLEVQYHQPSDQLRLWAIGEAPRVAIDRLTNASSVYQVGKLTFVPEGGLWCACNCREWNSTQLHELWSWMGHVGLGGERSSGCGQFDVLDAVKSPEFPDPSTTPYFVTLSHYHPQISEYAVLGDHSAFSLLQRRGWMDSPDSRSLRRRTVRMIAAGSLLHSLSDVSVYGDLIDVTPSEFRRQGGHTVWRYGYALALGAYSM